MTSRELLRRILRNVALGAPLVVGPLAIAGCTRCDPGPSMQSRHALTDDVTTILGTGASFNASLCPTVCRSLDFPSDAGVPDGGTSTGGMIDPFFAARGASVSCAYEPGELVCTYQLPDNCYTQGLCFSATPGRAPQSLLPETKRAGVAGWLAEAARLEAASVPAFDELAMELALHGAPDVLVRAARRSARDEARHATLVGRLARRYGETPAAFRRDAHAPRSLADVTADNAAEGCVREALGAVAAAHQAGAATDPEVRLAFASIARDEARHALLSFAIDDWARGRLDRSERGRATDAAELAIERTREEASREPSLEMAALLGMPDATRASDLAALVS